MKLDEHKTTLIGTIEFALSDFKIVLKDLKDRI